MPRCIQCQRMRASGEVRKLPSRDAYRCKDKFACLLAETNSEPYTLIIEVTVPAKNLEEARQIGRELTSDSRQVVPMTLVEVRTQDGSTVDVEDIRRAVVRGRSA